MSVDTWILLFSLSDGIRLIVVCDILFKVFLQHKKMNYLCQVHKLLSSTPRNSLHE